MFPATLDAFGSKRNSLVARFAKAGITNSTFVKNYQRPVGMNADSSAGSPIATFTANRDASTPATYTDASGVIRLVTTSDVPRFAGGYYDATGFHAQKGLLIEGARTNLVPKSYTMNDASWDATNVTVVDGAMTDPAGGTNAASLTASNNAGTVLLHTAVMAATYSVYLKRKTGTGVVQITADGTNYSTVTLTSSWGKFSVSAASASQICGIKLATNADAIYVYGNQFENAPYASSFIPTTNGALTRNAEVLKYVTAGNRTAASETVAIKFMPMGGSFANDGVRRIVSTTETKERRSGGKGPTGLVAVSGPNVTDNSTIVANGTTTLLLNTSYVNTSVFQHSSPYVNNYLNGASEATYTTGDWTDPAWGTYFRLGGNVSGAEQLNGLIQSVAIFSDAKAVGDVVKITAALNA